MAHNTTRVFDKSCPIVTLHPPSVSVHIYSLFPPFFPLYSGEIEIDRWVIYLNSLIFSMAPKGGSRIGMEDTMSFFRIQRCRGQQRELSTCRLRLPLPGHPTLSLQPTRSGEINTERKDLIGYIL
jgi:hypothetical protein